MPMGEEEVFTNYGLLRSKEIPEGDWGFAGKTFKDPVEFHGTFAGKAIFKGCTFEKYMDFSNATFKGEVDFSGAVFRQGVSFRNATFITNGADVSFENAVFLPFDRNEVDALKKDKNTAEVDFSGAKFGKEYVRTHGEYAIWCGKEESGVKLFYGLKESNKSGSSVNYPDGISGSPLKDFATSINTAFSTALENPGSVRFTSCRFGAHDLKKVTKEMAEKSIAAETARLKKGFDLPENEPAPGLTALKKFVKEEGKGISEGEKTAIVRVLSRHLSSTELEAMRIITVMWVDFVTARFANAGKVYFDSATFANAGGVSFGSATFANAGKVYFDSATFANAGWVSFGSATFANAGEVSFGSATFANAYDVFFRKAEFANAGAVDFRYVIFANAGAVDFFEVAFEKTEEVGFYGTVFFCQGDVDFSETKFPAQKELIFEDCYFGGSISTKRFQTSEVKFDGITLPQTTFKKGRLPFESVGSMKTIMKTIKERGVPLPRETEAWIQELERARKGQIPAETPIFDEDIVVSWRKLKTPENIRFENVNLHSALFDSQTLSRVNLSAPVWRTAKKGKRRCMLLEEELLFEKKKELVNNDEYKNLLEQYLALKNHYENEKNFLLAGDFHYGEMEVRYRYAKMGWFDKAMTWAYRTFTGYGESMEAALCWLAGLVFVIVPVLLCFSAIWRGTVGWGSFIDLQNWKTLAIAYFRGVAELITPFSWKESIPSFSTANWHKYAIIILGQIGLYIQLPLFVLAVRRRFKR